MFITPAQAQGFFGFGGGEGGGLGAFAPIILIFVVFYFLLIRPQQKKVKQHRDMLSVVKRGDRVLTGGGIIGTVTRVKDNDELVVEIADGVKINVLRSTLSDVLGRSEPAGSSGGGGGGKSAGGPTVVGPGQGKFGGLLGGLLGGLGGRK
jgi:preprotein translocase subunit YajC